MEKILPWFHLKSVPGIGNHLFKRLIDRFGSSATTCSNGSSTVSGPRRPR